MVVTLREAGHHVTLVGVSSDKSDTKEHVGTTRSLDALGIDYFELYETGCDGDVIDMPNKFERRLINECRLDRILVDCPSDLTGEQFIIDEALMGAAAELNVPSVQSRGVWEI